MLRKSDLSNVVFASILPVRNPAPSGLKGTNPMPSSSSAGQHFRLWAAIPQRVFALNRRHRLDGMGAADCLDAWLGKAEMLNFAFRDQLLHRARDILNRNRGVDAMLIQHVNDLSLEAFKRCFRHGPDLFRPAVEASTARACLKVDVESELGSDHDRVFERAQGLRRPVLRS